MAVIQVDSAERLIEREDRSLAAAYCGHSTRSGPFGSPVFAKFVQ